MSDMYAYCSVCDSELNEAEKEMNETKENIFFPICEHCLKKSAEQLIRIINEKKN